MAKPKKGKYSTQTAVKTPLATWGALGKQTREIYFYPTLGLNDAGKQYIASSPAWKTLETEYLQAVELLKKYIVDASAKLTSYNSENSAKYVPDTALSPASFKTIMQGITNSTEWREMNDYLMNIRSFSIWVSNFRTKIVNGLNGGTATTAIEKDYEAAANQVGFAYEGLVLQCLGTLTNSSPPLDTLQKRNMELMAAYSPSDYAALKYAAQDAANTINETIIDGLKKTSLRVEVGNVKAGSKSGDLFVAAFDKATGGLKTIILEVKWQQPSANFINSALTPASTESLATVSDTDIRYFTLVDDSLFPGNTFYRYCKDKTSLFEHKISETVWPHSLLTGLSDFLDNSYGSTQLSYLLQKGSVYGPTAAAPAIIATTSSGQVITSATPHQKIIVYGSSSGKTMKFTTTIMDLNAYILSAEAADTEVDKALKSIQKTMPTRPAASGNMLTAATGAKTSVKTMANNGIQYNVNGSPLAYLGYSYQNGKKSEGSKFSFSMYIDQTHLRTLGTTSVATL